MLKKYLLLVAILLTLISLFAQNQKQCPFPPEGGNNNSLPTSPPTPTPGDNAGMAALVSVDPNELEGPIGIDSVRWVSVNDVLNYTIYFENDPEFATANAQIVDVRFDFPDKRLMKDFKLGRYGFANNAFDIEDEPNVYSTRIDMRDSMKIFVDLHAGLDITKNQGFWKFSSIDPESGYAPWQVDRGMLPVNDSTHVGEGFVTFRIKPYEDMVTGDTISFNANIVFDSNDTIPTNNWKVTVDTGMPTSKIIAKVDEKDYSHYMLSFTANDDENGSGLKRIFLYHANKMGLYEEYAVCPVDSIIDFYVEKGKQYDFFSIAEDRVGNKEPLKEKPDLTLNFNLPPSDLFLSNEVFQDDIALDGFIGELSSVDDEDETEFTYALAEGEGAIHNDMFAVVGNRLQANDCFKCANDTVYNIRLSTTDAGGLSFSKPFTLKMLRVLEQPKPDTLQIQICEGDRFMFHGEEYDKTGIYYYRVSNEFMCDSIYVLDLVVNPIPEAPTVTVSGKATLTSSAERGNQWYKDGWPIDNATEQVFTATETGLYYVTASNGTCESDPSAEYYVNLDEISEINIPLSCGWTWMSSNITEPSLKVPNKFFSSVISDLQTVRASYGELSNSGNTLVGDITSIEPATYKTLMGSQGDISLKGALAQPEDIEFALSPGWNWIPYIPVIDMGIDLALSDYTPQENDVIKSHTQFAIYSNGKWTGTLNEMHPNFGYMYYTSRPSNLRYSQSRVRMVNHEPMLMREYSAAWSCDESKFADNTTMIAELYDKEVPTIEGVFTVGAFCDDECRGVAEYVDGKLFMTIHGSYGSLIDFRAIENATGKEFTILEKLSIDEYPVGTLATPFHLTLDKADGLDNIYSTSDYNIYPNPVRDTMFIEGDLSDVIGVKVITVSGVTLISTDSFEHGINVSSIVDGVYVAAIITSHGVKYKKFLKKGF